jgi:hypothetical protein
MFLFYNSDNVGLNTNVMDQWQNIVPTYYEILDTSLESSYWKSQLNVNWRTSWLYAQVCSPYTLQLVTCVAHKTKGSLTYLLKIS